MKALFRHAQILGLRTIVAPEIIDIDSTLDSLYGGDLKALNRIKKVIGLQYRHIAPSAITASDLAFAAASDLLESFEKSSREGESGESNAESTPKTFDKSDIDALIFVTQTPDYRLPNNACVLQGALGLPKTCLAFDINHACAGYLYGLYVACALIESKAANFVLLVCGDTLSRYVSQRDKNIAPIIGDGVSATLLGRSKTPTNAYFALGSDGSGFSDLIIPKGASRTPTREVIPNEKVWETGGVRGLEELFMDGASIFNFAVGFYPSTFAEILAFAGLEAGAFDYHFFHQANKYIIDCIARTLGLAGSKVPNFTTQKYGNLSGASIPATICDALGARDSPQDSPDSSLDSRGAADLAGVSPPDSRESLPRDSPPKAPQDSRVSPDSRDLLVHLAGFGAGLAWGNAILSLPASLNIAKVGVYQYKKEKK